MTRTAVGVCIVCMAVTATAPPLCAAQLQPATAAAFDRYVAITEAARAATGTHLDLEHRLEPAQREALAALRRGEILIEPRTTRPEGRTIDVPSGLIHHWQGVVFLPGVTIASALALLQDYDAHAAVYAPAVASSRLRSRQGDTLNASLRFVFHKVITVVVDSDHVARFARTGIDRAEGRVVSTRIAEVERPGTPEERLKPVGRDSGYLWRLNTYWRLLARDGGTYIECESISLTRGIPAGLGWLVGPFVTSIPRESLTFTLETTRRWLTESYPTD